VALIVVFTGFSRSFYLRPLFAARPITGLMVAHGIAMSTWFTLFVIQAGLIVGRKVKLHRQLGVAGTALAAAIVVMGTMTGVQAARLGHTPGPPPLVFLAIPLFDMLVFGVLVGLGIWFRRRVEAHKRLMLLADLGILAAAFARFPIGAIENGGPLAYFGLTDLLVLACVGYDTFRNRRLHPAFGWGAAFVILSHPIRLIVMGTPAWIKFAAWISG
jgi:hypothetical protein